jgi:hypothetical protein
MLKFLKTPLTIASLGGMALLSACHKSDGPGASPTIDGSSLADPVVLNLVPAQNQSPGDRRVYLPIKQVGSSTLNILTVFDTGSEGLVLSGSAVFPYSYISDTGMVIQNKDSLVVNGITITSAKVSITYGSPPATRTFYGNICYAQVTFGDQTASVQSLRLPFVSIYKGIDNQTQDSVPLDANSSGITGVISSGFTATNTLATTMTQVKSPFNYFNYTNGLYAGFMLNPFSSTGWTTSPSNSSEPTTPILTLGITEGMKAGFDLQFQRTDVGGAFDPDVEATLTYGSSSISYNNVLFDTGTPLGMSIYDASEGGSTTLTAGTSVSISTLQGYTYSYTTDNAFYQTIVSSTGQQRCIFGIDFFLNNYFMFDYTEHYIGLKGAS